MIWMRFDGATTTVEYPLCLPTPIVLFGREFIWRQRATSIFIVSDNLWWGCVAEANSDRSWWYRKFARKLLKSQVLSEVNPGPFPATLILFLLKKFNGISVNPTSKEFRWWELSYTFVLVLLQSSNVQSALRGAESSVYYINSLTT